MPLALSLLQVMQCPFHKQFVSRTNTGGRMSSSSSSWKRHCPAWIHPACTHAISPLLIGSKGWESQLEEETDGINARERRVLWFFIIIFFLLFLENTESLLNRFLPSSYPSLSCSEDCSVNIPAGFFPFPLFPTYFRKNVFPRSGNSRFSFSKELYRYDE